MAWLIKDYVDYLLEGGQPVTLTAADEPGPQELAALAQNSRAFDWLVDEPDLSSADDGEPVRAGVDRSPAVTWF